MQINLTLLHTTQTGTDGPTLVFIPGLTGTTRYWEGRLGALEKNYRVLLVDRIDIHIEVPRVDCEKLSGDRVEESSEAIRMRVQAARDIQNKRFSGTASDIVCNADMRVGEIRQFCKLQDEGQSLMRSAMSQ